MLLGSLQGSELEVSLISLYRNMSEGEVDGLIGGQLGRSSCVVWLGETILTFLFFLRGGSLRLHPDRDYKSATSLGDLLHTGASSVKKTTC